MARVKGGMFSQKRRRHLLSQTKGFRWGRKSKIASAKQAVMKALSYNYRDRKVRKRDFRRAWEVSISSACKAQGTSYSKFIFGLKKNKIELNRKILAGLVINNPKIFEKIIEAVK
ncbi:MAG: 50S ribosomal protein L20 [Candidatus Nealsonbacteria bacterium RIFCSPLOWO2_01_FULL_41_9]|uniref:Large ribosomal subunit protein bL20 n=1 Tax=Candidatus Nealsonbacteria bacterium RIFCSPLOWO2_01_FULL_41_9 TaxID=1801671 RepID=A0A1G2EE72_9BACT|nr:MAG: 50S ribosomal protein L20 [Candidatus Nealsonbacteria bacterium RIFCSPLOWO2_01_FULL_41_9]